MRARKKQPVFLRSPADAFPDPLGYDPEGLVAIGGGLDSARLLAAYRHGIFPWYAEGLLPMWWCPDPRAVLTPEALHTSRSLCRTIRRGGFDLTWNRCFARVMAECGRHRPEGTWVIPEMLEAYRRLHREGHAHSLEVWSNGDLVGGIYGVQVGGLFAAESMFHRRSDMSKIALVTLVRSLFGAGITLFDVQFLTPHLQSLGAFEVTREEYLRWLLAVRDQPVALARLRPVLEPQVGR